MSVITTRPIPRRVSVFGTEYISAESLGVTTTSSTILIEKLNMTTAALPNGTYRFGWSYQWNHNETVDDFLALIQLNNAIDIEQIQIEPKDAGGVFGSTGTNQRLSISGFKELILSGVQSFDLDFATSVFGSESSIWNAKFELWRLS